MKKSKLIINYPMLKWAKSLFPLCRSLTGKGTQQTLYPYQNLNKKISSRNYFFYIFSQNVIQNINIFD